VPPEHDVVEHAEATEQRNILERAGDAELGDGGGFGVVISRPSNVMVPLVGR